MLLELNFTDGDLFRPAERAAHSERGIVAKYLKVYHFERVEVFNDVSSELLLNVVFDRLENRVYFSSELVTQIWTISQMSNEACCSALNSLWACDKEDYHIVDDITVLVFVMVILE